MSYKRFDLHSNVTGVSFWLHKDDGSDKLSVRMNGPLDKCNNHALDLDDSHAIATRDFLLKLYPIDWSAPPKFRSKVRVITNMGEHGEIQYWNNKFQCWVVRLDKGDLPVYGNYFPDELKLE